MSAPFPRPSRPIDRVTALDRYWTITEELMSLMGELALIQQNETQAKSNAWMTSQTESVTARDRYATAAALNFTVEKYDVQLSIEAIKTELQFLDRFLQYAG